MKEPMRAEHLIQANIVEISKYIDSGDTSAKELVSIFLDRATSLNKECHAFIEMMHDEAIKNAHRLDQTTRTGPLHGIPYGVKDIIDVKGVQTTGGSAVLRNNIAKEDSDVVATLRKAGANILGKLNLHEFAYGATGENTLYGTPVNAYDKSCLSGGSSSGSATAVAWGILPFALGTDTVGSIRAPAALNGLVGLKPTYGKVSMQGIIPYCWSLDHVGIIARSVGDVALILDEISKPNSSKKSSKRAKGCNSYNEIINNQNAKGLRIGIPKEFFFENIDKEIKASTFKAVKYLESKGAILKDVKLPDMDHTRTVSLTIQMPEALSFHMPWLKDRSDYYSSDFRAGLALGQNILAEHYVRCKRMLTTYRDRVNQIFNEVDLIITPSTPIVAPKLGCKSVTIENLTEPVGNAITRFTSFFNMTGHPAISIPSGIHSNGLPIGVQLVGRQFGELELLKFAIILEGNPECAIPKPLF